MIMQNLLLATLPSPILSASPVSQALGVSKFQMMRQAEEHAYHRRWPGWSPQSRHVWLLMAVWELIDSLTLNHTRRHLPVESELGRECLSL